MYFIISTEVICTRTLTRIVSRLVIGSSSGMVDDLARVLAVELAARTTDGYGAG